jgi:predicted nucleotidyltransferase component of viral defense system
MFFYDLPRFSVDLDFDVFEEINKENKKKIIENMQKILKNF